MDGLYLAATLDLERGPQGHPGAVILNDSRPALVPLHAADQPTNSSCYPKCSLMTKWHTVASRGCDLRLHWLPGDSGIRGNEDTEARAREAHQEGAPVSRDVTAFEEAPTVLARMVHTNEWMAVQTIHPDPLVVTVLAVRPLPARTNKEARWRMLHLRLDCCNVKERRHCRGHKDSPTYAEFSEPETPEHLLCFFYHHVAQRAELHRTLQRRGLPSAGMEDLL
ncbi:uncharacterized protein LOC144148368 [Haemaphysalis longicornis]